MSDERDQQDEGTSAEDAKEDLELKDEDADEVRGGAMKKVGEDADKSWK